MPEQVRIDLLDHSGSVVTTTSTFTSLRFTSRVGDKGDFRLDFPIQNALYSGRDDDYIYQVWYKYPEQGIDWTPIFYGIDKTEVDDQAENGRRTFTAYGPDEMELLDKSFIQYAAGSAQATKSGVATTVMYAYVLENIGASATIANGRTINGTNPITNGVNPIQGPTWSGGRSNKNLLETLQVIRQYSIDQNNQVDFRVSYQNGYNFLFEAGVLGTDRTTTGLTATSNGLNGAGNPPVIFSPTRGNLRRLTVSNSRYNEANVVTALGQGLGASRLVGVASDGTSIGVSPIAQREAIVNAVSQDTVTELETVAGAKLDELAARRKVTALPRDGANILYRDYFLGDFVTVELFDGTRINRQITEVEINVAYSGSSLIVNKDVKLSDD